MRFPMARHVLLENPPKINEKSRTGGSLLISDIRARDFLFSGAICCFKDLCVAGFAQDVAETSGAPRTPHPRRSPPPPPPPALQAGRRDNEPLLFGQLVSHTGDLGYVAQNSPVASRRSWEPCFHSPIGQPILVLVPVF